MCRAEAGEQATLHSGVLGAARGGVTEPIVS